MQNWLPGEYWIQYIEYSFSDLYRIKMLVSDNNSRRYDIFFAEIRISLIRSIEKRLSIKIAELA